MSPELLAEFEQQLQQRCNEYKAVADTANQAVDTVELDQSRVGRLSRMDALQAQAMSVEGQRRRGVAIKQITAALMRLSEGDFGYCLECGEVIAIERLRVDPSTPLCIGCASKAEMSGHQ